MKVYSANEIVIGLAKRKDRVIRHIYETCYPDIRKLILLNGGNEQDAQDIFQEGLMKVYQKVTEQRLELKCRFGTYLYSVCRFLWLNEIEKNRSRSYELTEDPIDDSKANDKIRENASMKLYEKHFQELSKECQTVLNMYFQRASMEEICVAMGYKTVGIAKDKKYRCKKSLMNKIYNNPVFRRLEDEIHLAG